MFGGLQVNTLRGWLLASVSALTLICGANTSEAQDRPKITIGASGGYVMGPNSTADEFFVGDYYDFTSIEAIPTLTGNYSAVVVGAEVMPAWDIRAKLAATHTRDTSVEFEYDDPDDKLGELLGEMGTGLDYQTLDIELGYTPALDDDFEVRLIAGVRALHYSDRLEVTDKIGEQDEETTLYENDFLGIGPCLGIEASQRFASTSFGVSASAAGAVAFGGVDQSVNGEDPISDGKVIATLEGTVGVDYYIGDVGKLTFGYRGEVLSGVHDFEIEGGELHSYQVTHGPVLEFLASF